MPARHRPFFAFVNYMEAHDPLLPPRRHRERFLSEELVEASYTEPRTWRLGWQYTYGLRSRSERQTDIHAGVYDAAIAELDELFSDLISRLELEGHLEDTIVVVTSDHGEHLGDHGMVGHRYSLYEELLAIPLVLHAPGRIQSGRSSAPATNLDLFSTLLKLARIPTGPSLHHRSLDLLELSQERARLAEYPGDFPIYATRTSELPEDFEESRWTRNMKALSDGDYKLIWASDGDHELYHLKDDPGELRDLSASEAGARDRLLERLEDLQESLVPHSSVGERSDDPDFVRQLEAIGY